jgi:hypothetical protein
MLQGKDCRWCVVAVVFAEVLCFHFFSLQNLSLPSLVGRRPGQADLRSVPSSVTVALIAIRALLGLMPDILHNKAGAVWCQRPLPCCGASRKHSLTGQAVKCCERPPPPPLGRQCCQLRLSIRRGDVQAKQSPGSHPVSAAVCDQWLPLLLSCIILPAVTYKPRPSSAHGLAAMLLS